MNLEDDLEAVRLEREKELKKDPEFEFTDERLRELLDQALKNMFRPSEIDYYIALAKKKKSLSDEVMIEIYNKAVTTLEIELTKLGLNEIFHRIKD